MSNFFENLKNKPRSSRQIFAFVFSSVLTLTVFSFWVYKKGPEISKFAGFSVEKEETKSSSVALGQKEKKNTLTPVETMKNNMSELFGMVSKEILTVKDQFSSFLGDTTQADSKEENFNNIEMTDIEEDSSYNYNFTEEESNGTSSEVVVESEFVEEDNIQTNE